METKEAVTYAEKEDQSAEEKEKTFGKKAIMFEEVQRKAKALVSHLHRSPHLPLWLGLNRAWR